MLPTFEIFSVLSILLAWLIYMLIGVLWYSNFFFGPSCDRLSIPTKTMPSTKASRGLSTVLGSLGAIVFFVYTLQKMSCQSCGQGVLWGIAYGLFFDVGLNASHSYFEKRHFLLAAIHMGYHGAGLGAVGGLLGALCNGGR